MLAVLLLNRMTARRRSMVKQKVPQKTITQPKNERKRAASCCRTCLATEGLVSIFHSKESEEKRSEDLKLATGLKIKANDGLPQKICTPCLDTVATVLQFRRTSRKAEKTLLSMVLGKSKKKSKYASKVHKKVAKTPKTKRKVVELEKELEENCFDDFFGGDFQNDDDYVKNEVEEKPAVKQFARRRGPGAGRKQLAIPNAASYKCGTCNKEFRMKATYKAHMRFHTNYCVCELCGKRCRNNNQLQEHKRARHGLGRIHKCAYCEYSSATKEALTIHERRHTGERPYICDHCGASFHRRSNLVQHIAIHLPDKNFQCEICLKRVKSQKLLQIHLYKAHKEKKYRYVCPACRDTFSRPGNVRQHLIRSHGVPRAAQGAIDKFQIHMPPIPDPDRILPYDAAAPELKKLLTLSATIQH